MRVGIDVTELRPGPPGGVRTALRLLLSALTRHAPGLQVTAFAPGVVQVPPGVHMQPTGGPEKPRRWRRSRELRHALKTVDLFHSPVTAIPKWDGPVLTATVHELPFMVRASFEGQWRALIQWHRLSHAMSRCGALVVPSEATRSQVVELHPAAARITHVVPHPAPPAPEAEQRSHDGSVLYVGRLDRRKQLEAVLRGVAQARGEIRIAGPHRETEEDRLEQAAVRLGLEGRVRFMGEVDVDTLDYLYRQACAVALVSGSEGFGFPVLEGLARGVPVIVQRGTGAHEVAGDVALAIDATDPEEFAAALQRAADPAYRAEVRAKGPARCLEFSPERTARGYVEAFHRALGR